MMTPEFIIRALTMTHRCRARIRPCTTLRVASLLHQHPAIRPRSRPPSPQQRSKRVEERDRLRHPPSRGHPYGSAPASPMGCTNPAAGSDGRFCSTPAISSASLLQPKISSSLSTRPAVPLVQDVQAAAGEAAACPAWKTCSRQGGNALNSLCKSLVHPYTHLALQAGDVRVLLLSWLWGKVNESPSSIPASFRPVVLV